MVVKYREIKSKIDTVTDRIVKAIVRRLFEIETEEFDNDTSPIVNFLERMHLLDDDVHYNIDSDSELPVGIDIVTFEEKKRILLSVELYDGACERLQECLEKVAREIAYLLINLKCGIRLRVIEREYGISSYEFRNELDCIFRRIMSR